MGDLTAEQVRADFATSDRKAYIEQRIYVLSPFGTWPTTILLFFFFAGSYALIALVEGVPVFVAESAGLTLDARARIAFILALLMSVILGLQRYTLIKQRSEMFAAARVFEGGLATVSRMASLTPPNTRLGAATIVGIVLGAAIIWPVFASDPDVRNHIGILVWFSGIILLLTMSFTRGVELTLRGAQNSGALLQTDLRIDLLRIDQLSFLGRSAARFAAIWFAVGAMSCLFFVSNGITKFTVSLMALFVLIGAATFFSMMEGIHRRIQAVKGGELEILRSQIDTVKSEAARDAGAAQKLQGLLAYESRIAAAPEWPFDQTTLVRVCASVLILTLPWFGQAIAAYLIEHLGSR